MSGGVLPPRETKKVPIYVTIGISAGVPVQSWVQTAFSAYHHGPATVVCLSGMGQASILDWRDSVFLGYEARSNVRWWTGRRLVHGRV
jgi:hypothetical protein